MSEDTEILPVTVVSKGLLTRIREGFTYKNGEFSKTALFTSVAYVLVLIAYVISWGAGAKITLVDVLTFTLPRFDNVAAITLLSITSGTYLGNNLIKKRSQR